MVEFAIIVPILVLFVFGIIEFGNMFLQNLDVRHGAREGARLAVVNGVTGSDDGAAIKAALSNRMEDSAGSVYLLYSGSGNRGDIARVCVERSYQELTKILTFAISGVTLRSTVDMRIEQAVTWSEDTSPPSWCPQP